MCRASNRKDVKLEKVPVSTPTFRRGNYLRDFPRLLICTPPDFRRVILYDIFGNNPIINRINRRINREIWNKINLVSNKTLLEEHLRKWQQQRKS